ncbi:glycoprotein-n-acetylgalactosamine 3-beta-galactosyltransferase 1 [Plakobranchus ocellatus]|uniref:N-acetylgalactosaminide beta-1,3-galactosyltransferase n=1 Tax=Plakobranchus ocellatus TaxID=259542 RepID=A0AAV4CYX0_9GAST|nr:glycoprotein-n-acetylgalactosamine 3-beta-galactosyltransferase 1 [Plakobranchus ocellatus]
MAQAVRYFGFGLVIGMTIAFLCLSFSHLAIPSTPVEGVDTSEERLSPGSHELLDRDVAKDPVLHLDLGEDKHHHHDDDSLARKLKDQVRVLVWVMTSPQNLEKKATIVRDTWGRRCNKILFFSSENNKSFPTIGLDVPEGREHLTAKTMKGFRYADDDTYVIVENLRYFLSEQNTSSPIYFGHHFKTIVKQGYYSGGGGYVLSREALRRLATKGSNPNVCRQDGGAEDAELGHCMERLGVRTANSTDALGRSRFHCFDPETHLFGGYPDWYYNYDANGAKKGPEHISDYAISFHYVPPQKMLSLEYYIYHLQPYGISSGKQELNRHDTNT